MEERNPVLTVHNIFNDFFGEENVDLQGLDIIVHFPKVTVTNENNRSIDITELWAKVNLCQDGTVDGGFKLVRSEFTKEQFLSGYSHSHISSVSRINFNNWFTPCLGTGPIRDTLSSLACSFSEEMWQLFCLELSKYVTVESLEGRPYMYLERVGAGYLKIEPVEFKQLMCVESNDNQDRQIDSFIPYVISKKPFDFNYINNCYGVAMSEKDIIVTLSNLFIEWYNSLPKHEKSTKEELFDYDIVRKGKIIKGRLCYVSPQRTSMGYTSILGREMFTFKGKPVKFNITERQQDEDPNESILLSPNMLNLILNRILRTINNKYGKREDFPSTRETQWYL